VSQPIEALKNAWRIPELRNRIKFTLAMLAVYRLGAHVPTPGVDGQAMAEAVGAGGLVGFYDMFTGGAFQRATLFALGIMPYISASIIMQLLVNVVPALERLQRLGAEGQKKITEYTRYATIGLCVVQSIGYAAYVQNLNQQTAGIVPNPGFGFYLLCIISFTTGTAFLMWLGEQISEYGVGNGVSLIIFTSIVSRGPSVLNRMVNQIRADQMTVFAALLLVALMVVVVAGVVWVTTGQRRIPVQYPRQIRGRKQTAGGRSYLPLRVNQAGVIPIIFASSLLMLPTMLASSVNMPFAWMQSVLDAFRGQGLVYSACYAVLIFVFTFFYTSITFNPVEMADNMKKYGGVVMGVRPGRATADYLNYVMNRVTFVGAAFLVAVALTPTLLYYLLDIRDMSITSFFGGTSLLILVGVGLDVVRHLEQHLTMRNYDGFMKGGMPRRR
jgi:preprotein translocase subunit SecY